MERTSRVGCVVLTNLNESHEMRRSGEKFSWDLKVLKIPQDDEIQRDFSPINAIAVHVSNTSLIIASPGSADMGGWGSPPDIGTINRFDLRLIQTEIHFSNGNLNFDSQIGAPSTLRQRSKKKA